LSLQSELLAWFDARRRDLPWRRTKDPYAIWVSEVMLQQTQVATAIPYFNRWMERFPTIEVLALASEADVLELWQGLGYYRRARGLLEGAKQVARVGLPQRASDWVKVPGIGKYTAGAIASIAGNEPVPVVDGNVERVYARLNCDDSIGNGLTNCAWQWAAAALCRERPGDWNQALMELGATVCRPEAPACDTCPVTDYCDAFRVGRQSELPKSAPKAVVKRLTHHVWIPICGAQFGMRQIPGGKWWAGMWEFPRENSICELESILPSGFPVHLGSFSHSVTNHRIRVHVSRVELDSPMLGLSWIDGRELAKLAMPAPQRKALGMLTASGWLDGRATRQA